MDLHLALRILQSAGGDPIQLCFAAVDLAFPNRSEQDKLRLKNALEAASIPHWFDGCILAKILDIPIEEGISIVEDLKCLSLIESFRARGEMAVNVHEKSRLLLREHLFLYKKKHFGMWSAKAAECFASKPLAQARIEWIYHQLCSGAVSVEEDLEKLDQDFVDTAHPEDRLALAAALQELENAKMLSGAAQAMSLISIGFVRNSRGESSQILTLASQALGLARTASRKSIVGLALCLNGDISQNLGKFDEAITAYEECLSTYQELVNDSPMERMWTHRLSTAYEKISAVLKKKGDFDSAFIYANNGLTLSKKLAAEFPDDIRFQVHLASIYLHLGGILQSQSKLNLAKQAFTEALIIGEKCVRLDPLNADWQHCVGVSYSKLGSIFKSQSELDKAHDAAEKSLTISLNLVKLDPTNVAWQEGLASSHHQVAGIFSAKGDLEQAYRSYKEDLSISQILLEFDPENIDYQQGYASTSARVGSLLIKRKRLKEAREYLNKSIELLEKLVSQFSNIPNWRDQLKMVRQIRTRISIKRSDR
ncbi:tetratricopeptide repeat protein [Prosthecobacter vanneervenii]|uniref:Tetratricopeptide (TPR) repeat protein n=1 Tax=Prosthecobacter vanneervenii TaxID=48466 RepID=A0A7W7Y930_9BACT|nr:tetratricopeptide repeat protein [Prosthecobacter vanneervenii]MBB5031515.1 tetratricopeptide (TPR) repeat protein [Prosthecobacter vanneervenii]